MPEGQEAIYYLTGASRASIENSPHIEAFRAKGYEVLLLTDQVDEVWTDVVSEFDGTPMASIAKGDVDLGTADEKPEGFEELLSWMGTELADDVKEVRLSTRLTTSPACLVGDPGDLSPMLEKMYRAMGQEPPVTKRILELNPQHALVTGLRDKQGAGDADPDVARLLYGMALLAEGGELKEPTTFVNTLAERLQKTL
jgi:molecular chaperone HtpG